MWRNYLTSGWRHFTKNSLFSLINVVGFAVGLMSCILILLFVRAESGYDTWIPDHDRIVRLHSAFYDPGGRPPFITVRSAGKMKDLILDEAPDLVEAGVRLLHIPPTVRAQGKADLYAETVTFADHSFFDVFDLPFVHGDPLTSFTKPMDLLVSEEMAIKYFGRTDVIGETLTICCLPSGALDVAITGVIRNLPANTHLDIDFLTVLEDSMFAFAPHLLDTWNSVNVYSYFKLQDGTEKAALKERYYNWINSESPFAESRNQMSDEQKALVEGKQVTDFVKPTFMPIADIYLEAHTEAGSMGDMRPLGDGGLITTFAGVAALIVLIAGINFTNLSTARATRRAREVAMRKVLGASRHQVALQFLGEAVGVALVALVLALVGVELVLPAYNDLIGRELSLASLTTGRWLVALIGGAISIGLIAGLYPAVVLSRFLPVKTLKSGQSSADGTTGGMRQVLVVFQFAVSIGLAVCTAVVYGQTLYARTIDTGYTTANKLVVNSASATDTLDLRVVAEELKRVPGVTSAVISSEVPSQDWNNNTGYTLEGLNPDGTGDPVEAVLNIHAMDFGFFDAYDIDIVAGRPFDPVFGTDALPGNVDIFQSNNLDTQILGSALLNESAARVLGFENPADIIGRTLRQNNSLSFTIVGVTEDIYFRSIKFGIRPSIYMLAPERFSVITVDFNTAHIPTLVAAVEAAWKDAAPEAPIELQFLDEMLANQYARETGEGLMFAGFSALAILVASLGLYGLASFTAERRTKEMGIRKVMGARVFDIIRLMVWQFSKPVLLANLIAWPVAWVVMQNWLERFEYRLEDGFIVVTALICGLIALLIAWATVVGRSLVVARLNPVHVLRYE